MFKKSIFALCVFTLVLSSCTIIKPVSDTDEKGNYIVPKKQLKLTVWNPADFEEKQISDKDVVADWLTEKTNVTVSKIYGNNGKLWTDRLAQLVMDGQLPNIVNASGGEGMLQFLKLDKIKKVYKLTETEIKEYAPNLWKRTPKEYWDYLKNKDGDIIGSPYDLPIDEPKTLKGCSDDEKAYIKKYAQYENDIFPQKGKCLWIRDDILKDFYPEAKSWKEIAALEGEFLGDELLDIPISATEEYIDFMYGIGEREYAAQNNKKVFAFGYCGENAASDINMLGADMYGYKNRDLFTSWNGDKINLMLDDEIVMSALRTQNKMIYDGIINGESINDTEKEYIAKVLNGQYAIIAPSIGGEEINKMLRENGRTFRYRPFLTNITSEYEPYREKDIWGGAICILNNLSAAQVHQVLNWINVRYSDEFESVNNWGTKKMYTENDSGKRLFKNDRLNRYFILGEKNAIQSESELYGISGGGSLLNILPSKVGKYTPSVMYQSSSASLSTESRLRFSPGSAHVSALRTKPTADITSSIYTGIPEVTEFLTRKNEIETEAKRILLKAPEEFDTKWTEFIGKVHTVTDISAMEEKMTAAVR